MALRSIQRLTIFLLATMQTAIKIILNILKWLLAILIFLFSIATFMGHSYLQTFFLWLTVAAILYWPGLIQKRLKKRTSVTLRWAIVIMLLVLSFVVFKPEPKSSIYISEKYHEELIDIYNRNMQYWPSDTEDIYINTKYGSVHVLSCGDKGNPPLVMIHAASMGAHSWADNLEPLLDHYRIYSVDNIGSGNKSELLDPLIYPETQEEIADHFAEIMDALGVKRSPVFGASNGGFIAMCYTYYYPERVKSLSLFGPMGLTQLTGNSIMMLSIASMYPFEFIRDKVAVWALGHADIVRNKYGEWFNCILKGTIPSLGTPVPMSREQKLKMTLPVLLLLGTEDHIVGDAETARKIGEDYPDIRIEVLESGHLIATEHASYVNSAISDFLGIN